MPIFSTQADLYKLDVASLAVDAVNAAHYSDLNAAITAAMDSTGLSTVIVPPGSTHTLNGAINFTSGDIGIYIAPGANVRISPNASYPAGGAFNIDGSNGMLGNIHIFGEGSIDNSGVSAAAVRMYGNVRHSGIEGVHITGDNTPECRGVYMLGDGTYGPAHCSITKATILGCVESFLFQDTLEPVLDGGLYGDIPTGATSDVGEFSNSDGGTVKGGAVLRNPGQNNACLDVFTRSGGSIRKINISDVTLSCDGNIPNTGRKAAMVGGPGSEETVIFEGVNVKGIETADGSTDENSFSSGYQTYANFTGTLVATGGSIQDITATQADAVKHNGDGVLSLVGVEINRCSNAAVRAIKGILLMTGGIIRNSHWDNAATRFGVITCETDIRRFNITGVDFDRGAPPTGSEPRQLIRTDQNADFEMGLINGCSAHGRVLGARAESNLLSNGSGNTADIYPSNNYLRKSSRTVILDHTTTV